MAIMGTICFEDHQIQFLLKGITVTVTASYSFNGDMETYDCDIEDFYAALHIACMGEGSEAEYRVAERAIGPLVRWVP